MAMDLEANRPERHGISEAADRAQKVSPGGLPSPDGASATTTSAQPSLKDAPFQPGPEVKTAASFWQPRTWTRKMKFTAAAVLAIVCIIPAIAVPSALHHAKKSGSSQHGTLGDGASLRIMPLGASITYGTLSSDGNGYRNDLRESLVKCGNEVNMVGSRRHGKMADNDVEGWPGYRIDQVLTEANASVPKWKPNVILINAGTNDCLQNRDVAHAADRMRGMINRLWEWSPRATIVLSTLIPNKDSATEARVLDVNKDFRALAKEAEDGGEHLVLAEMHSSNGPQLADMADQTHPNDKGYAKMAAIWYAALREASDKRYLLGAEDIGIPDDGAA